MRLGFGEAILIASLVALGWVSVRDQRTANRNDLVGMVRRERDLQQDVVRLRQRQRCLENESYALANDPYYIERRVREDLGWIPLDDTSSSASQAEGLAAMALDLDRAPQNPIAQEQQDWPPQPQFQPQPRPQPPAPPPPGSAGREALAALGYLSPKDFQQKMMDGRGSGDLDETTLARANGLVAMLGRSGCPSVKAFQGKQGLAADGVLGKRTEQRLREVVRDLEQQQARRTRSARTSVIVHGGSRDRTRPGG
jgi:hypothetical protein